MTYRRIEAHVYEISSTGYRVERMNNGYWDAYLLDACGYRLWQSPMHRTREGARLAASAERRRVRRAVYQALSPKNHHQQGSQP